MLDSFYFLKAAEIAVAYRDRSNRFPPDLPIFAETCCFRGVGNTFLIISGESRALADTIAVYVVSLGTPVLGRIALSWQTSQFGAGTNVGMNRVAPDLEIFAGVSHRL
jgi:hypothetical protein